MTPFYIWSGWIRKPNKLHVFMPILGLVQLIKSKRIPDRLTTLFLLIFLTPLIISLVNFDLYGIKRASLTALLIYFSIFLRENYSKDELVLFLRNGVFLYVFVFILEFLLAPYIQMKYIFPGISEFRLPILNGGTGFSNHTGMFLAGAFGFFLFQRKRKLALLSFLAIIPTWSRFALISVLVFLLFFLINKISRKIMLYASYSMVIICFLSPLLHIGVEKGLGEDLKKKVAVFSHDRTILPLIFLEVFKDNPLGVGVDRSQDYYMDYRHKGSSLLENKTIQLVYKSIGPHNTFIKILCEYGFLSYLFFAAFTFQLLRRDFLTNNGDFAPVFSITIMGYLSLNGFTEFFLYWLIAIMCMGKDKND